MLAFSPPCSRRPGCALIWDEHDPLALDLLESRPDDEPLAETFHAVISETLSRLYRRDPERLLARVRLAVTVRELRARFLDEQTHGVELLAPLLVTKRGVPADDLSLRVIGSALLAAVSVALDLWQLAFLSSAYVPVASMPSWLQLFAEHQPLTYMVDAVRALTLGPDAQALLGHPTSYLVTRALLWALAIIVASVPLAVAKYRRG